MRQTVFAALIFAAQPGASEVFITVVDSAGEPIRDAWVKIVPRSDGKPDFVERAFQPTDGSLSKFAALLTRGIKGEYEVEATAEGYYPVRKMVWFDRSSVSDEITLELNGQPRPKLEPLVTLSGKLKNNFGEAMYGLRVQGPSGYFFTPKVDNNGNYSIRVVPGTYRIEFRPSGCTMYTLEDYQIGKEDKVLNLQTECKHRRTTN